MKLGMISRLVVAAALAGGMVAAPPAFAQKQAKAAPMKFSKQIQPILAEAQKLQQAGNDAGALAKLAEAEAVPNQTVDDIYMVNALTLNSGITTKNNDLIASSLEKMLATGKVSEADAPKFWQTIGSVALAKKDYTKATNAYQKLLEIQPNDPDTMIGLSEIFISQKLNTEAVQMLGRAIDAKAATGQPVPETWLKRRLAVAYDAKLADAVVPSAVALVKAYPTPVNWRDASVIARDAYKLDDQATLDFLRFQAASKSLSGERDFVEYADTALGRGFPGEAKMAVDAGIAANMIDPSKPLIKELKTTADGKAAADKAALPGLEREIKGNARLALATGDAYYGYANYTKAAELYRQAVGAANVDQPMANLRLGAALAMAGDKAAAAEAFKAVKGGPREALASLWMAFIGA
ncbi:tetratricopeptide repeat protein [Polymorphobacter sp.]|uniref:tetratricopeptide repeat protein n=1 Tax=Polymorphobacter sp. TaxID=1909290 RepID=UPI003F6FB935